MKASKAIPVKSSAALSYSCDHTSAPGPVQCKGYAARTAYPLPVLQAAKNNTGLPDDLKAGMERLSGLSMDGVNVHYNSPAPASIGAHAYAQGTDIHLAPGQEKHLPHEAWHVVQQLQSRVKPTLQMKGMSVNADAALEQEADAMGKRAVQATSTMQAPLTENGPGAQRNGPPVQRKKTTSNVVQADIGFEFETQGVETKRSHTNNLPAGGFPNAIAGQAAWNSAKSTRVKKGAALLSQPDIEVQADDRGADKSDLEVVTTHFPLNAGGRNRLANAMTDLDALITAHQALAATAGSIVPAKALDNTANFTTTLKDGMMSGPWQTATTAPQVTFGTRVQNVADIVRDLHGDPTETLPQKTARDPGRLHMRRANAAVATEPRALSPIDEAQTLITGHTLARGAVAAYQMVDNTAPGGPELEGFLTIIFAYTESIQRKMAFLKNHTPLMAKTNLATVFTTLPANVQQYYSQKDPTGKSNLERLVETSAGYAAKMNQPLFQGVYGLHEDDKVGQFVPQWYHKLTLSEWLRGLVLRDRKKGEAFIQFFHDTYGGSTKRRGTDKLTTKNFPGRPKDQEVEGYGALGNRMDKDVANPATPLPVFELRSASKPITYAAARQWALEFFDYIESLNANPGGGHTLMP